MSRKMPDAVSSGKALADRMGRNRFFVALIDNLAGKRWDYALSAETWQPEQTKVFRIIRYERDGANRAWEKFEN